MEVKLSYPASHAPVQTTCITLCYCCLKPWGRDQSLLHVAGEPKLVGCPQCIRKLVRDFNMFNAPQVARKGGRGGAAGGSNGRVLRSTAGLT